MTQVMRCRWGLAILSAALAVCDITAVWAAQAVVPPEATIVGARANTPAPDFTLPDATGRMRSLADKSSVNPADLAEATNYVQRALDEAMAGRPVSIPETRAYGCSVKY